MVFVSAIFVAGFLLAATQTVRPVRPHVEDDLLDQLVGQWHLLREFPNRKAENTALGEWVLDHHYLRISMKDVVQPAQYEAHIYITFEKAENRYVVHWMDVFAGSMPESLGYGTRHGNSIVFEWKSDDGLLMNTFAWHPETMTWVSKIEQTGKDGKLGVFCTDTYTRVP